MSLKKCIKIEKRISKFSEISFVFSDIFLYKEKGKLSSHFWTLVAGGDNRPKLYIEGMTPQTQYWGIIQGLFYTYVGTLDEKKV